jgi:hypothetical protein
MQKRLALRGADQVQHRQAADTGAAQRFAVDGDLAQAQGFVQGLHPGAEAGLERLRIEPIEDALQGVVGRDTVGQTEKLFEPVVADGGRKRRGRFNGGKGHRRLLWRPL